MHSIRTRRRDGHVYYGGYAGIRVPKKRRPRALLAVAPRPGRFNEAGGSFLSSREDLDTLNSGQMGCVEGDVCVMYSTAFHTGVRSGMATGLHGGSLWRRLRVGGRARDVRSLSDGEQLSIVSSGSNC